MTTTYEPAAAPFPAEKILVTESQCPVSVLLRELDFEHRNYLVITGESGQAESILSTEDFLGLIDSMRISQSAHTPEPTRLTLKDLIRVNHAFDFYVVDLKHPAPRYADFKLLPPRHTLILSEGCITSVIPRAKFSYWASEILPKLQVPMPPARD